MKMFRMKRLAYIFGLISLLWYTKIGYVTGYTSAAQENSENEEEIGVCGPVPNHGRMMAVLKPMSHVVLCTVNRIIDFGASIRAVQKIIEKFCLTFDTCVPTGKLSSNKGTNPEVVCLKEHILQEFLKEDGSMNVTLFDFIFNCLVHPLLPLQKQHIWSVIHWLLQMTNM